MTKHTYLFADQNIFMGIMCAVPAVFFAFDGFYAAAGIQTSMREPRKVSMAMALGVSIVSLIDILITLSLVLGTNSGKMVDLQVAS
jgi:amino acid transporter